MIEAQRYTSDGLTLGGEFQVNTAKFLSQRSPATSVDDHGRYVVVWDSLGSVGNDGDSYSIQGQRFLPEPDATLALAAGGAMVLALRRAREARAQRAATGLALRRKLS